MKFTNKRDFLWDEVGIKIQTEHIGLGSLPFYTPFNPKNKVFNLENNGLIVREPILSSWSSEEEPLYLIKIFELAINCKEMGKEPIRLSDETCSTIKSGAWCFNTLIKDPFIQKVAKKMRSKLMKKVTILINHGCTTIHVMYRQTFTVLLDGRFPEDNDSYFGVAYMDLGIAGEVE